MGDDELGSDQHASCNDRISALERENKELRERGAAVVRAFAIDQGKGFEVAELNKLLTARSVAKRETTIIPNPQTVEAAKKNAREFKRKLLSDREAAKKGGGGK